MTSVHEGKPSVNGLVRMMGPGFGKAIISGLSQA